MSSTSQEGIQDLIADVLILQGVTACTLSHLKAEQRSSVMQEAARKVQHQINSRRDLLAMGNPQLGAAWVARVERRLKHFQALAEPSAQVGTPGT